MTEPHIRGRRISVHQVSALVEECGEGPEAVADRYDLDVADVHHALAYYHDHPREIRDVEQEREDAMKGFRESIERPEGVDPDPPEMSPLSTRREHRPKDGDVFGEGRNSR